MKTRRIRISRRPRLLGRYFRRAGLTLVEIMVVIVIIGIVTSAVGFGVFKYLSEARTKTACQETTSIKGAITSYYATKNKYPQSLQELVTEKFISKDSVPKDPWGKEYNYLPPAPGTDDFQVFSLGRDGTPGGEGESADTYPGKPPCDQ
ncbi:MAG: Type II secretion system protein G [Myxococcota bacterium]|nr:Type II secretion system protein G [Myxococcota bacterium]